VLAVLTDGARAADDLVVATGLDAGTVAAALSELELLGLAAEGEGLFRSLAGR
jgi:predicted Rossmann fold nucleotide-binding protein DprA/Smf involved in DNA uptake